MSNIVINAESRVRSSTSAVRRMRREGLVPGVVYGADEDNVNIKMDHNKILHKLEEEAFHSSILELKVDGKSEQVILRDYDVHPASDVRIMHVDFQRVSRKEKLSMTVPLHFTGEEECEGVSVDGGIISRIMNDLDIVCLPADLPEYIAVDISGLRLGDSVTLAEVILPEGVESQILNADGDETQAVLHIAAPQVEVEPEPEEEGIEGEEVVEGEEDGEEAASDEDSEGGEE
jgi:large subunit ribosomal protein L25